MFLVEKLYSLKKDIVKWYKKYFTIEGREHCILPDKIYLKKMYKYRMGRKLNLKSPKTFNDKQNWLKLYDRRPEYTIMADKYKAREYIAERIGEEYLVPLLGVWDSPDEIDFDALPNEFVLKCNHDNGVIICRDKATLDIEKVKEELSIRLKRDYYKKLREWPYKNIPRKIICEKYMKNIDNAVPLEYKLFCYNGEPRYVLAVANRNVGSQVTMDTYDIEWNHTDLMQGDVPLAGDTCLKPVFLNELTDLSKKLSRGIPFLRVDFNIWNNKIYFGELTLYDSGGFEYYKPDEWDEKLGEWLELPKKRRR